MVKYGPDPDPICFLVRGAPCAKKGQGCVAELAGSLYVIVVRPFQESVDIWFREVLELHWLAETLGPSGT